MPRAIDMMMCQNAMPMAYEQKAMGYSRAAPKQIFNSNGGYGEWSNPTPASLNSFWSSELQNFMKI